MSRTVVLDSNILGLLVTPPGRSVDARDCADWLIALKLHGWRIIVPEIADYELRRELLRLNRTGAIGRLNNLGTSCEYVGLDTLSIRRAAELWAFARQIGQPTAGDNTIDADMILVAQAEMLGEADVVIATTNLRHLRRFTVAEHWRNISA